EMNGNCRVDPSQVEWFEDDGQRIRYTDLQDYQISYQPALRDVIKELRQSDISPLTRIINSSNIPEDEKQTLVDLLQAVNTQISATPTVQNIGTAIHDEFANTAGEAYPISLELGVVDPSFAAIARSLTI